MAVQVSYVGKTVENYNGLVTEVKDSPFLSKENIRYFRSLFSFLNPKDRDILYLIFLSQKKQTEVQDIMGRGQSSLCYDIKQIRRRLKCISYLHSVFDIFVEFTEKRARGLFTPQQIGVLTVLFFSTSYIITAETLGMSQVRVSANFEKCMDILKEKKIWEIYEIFYTIKDNLNVIKRTYRRKGVVLDEAIYC